MKKGLHIGLVMVLFIQQLLLMPFSAIAEDWSSDEGITFSSVALVDENGKELDKVENSTEVTVELSWEASLEASERTLYLPDALTAHPGTHVLNSKTEASTGDGNTDVHTKEIEAGEYILTEKKLTLNTVQTETKTSGQIRFSADLQEADTGKQTLTFLSEGDEWSINIDITDSQSLVVDKEMDQSITEKETASQPGNKTDNKTQETADSKAAKDELEDAEQSVGNLTEFVEDKETEDAHETSHTSDITQGAAGEEGAVSPDAFAEIGEQIQFSVVTFTDRNDNVFSEDNPYDLNATPIGRLTFDWYLTEGHTVTEDDTYTFQLPDEFKPVDGTTGFLGDIGSWTVNTAGVVTFSFNEAVDGDEVSGHFWFEISLDEEALSEAIEQEVAFDLEPDVTVTFPVTPKNSSLIDKQGTINNEGFNSTEAFWTVDINTALKEMQRPIVSDAIPEYMTFKEGSLQITSLNMTPQGDRNEGTVLSSADYSHEVIDGELVIDLSRLGEAQLKQAYRLTYATEITEPDEGFDGSQTFTNRAVLSSNGASYDARSTVSSGYGLAIEKSSPDHNAKEQTFDWTINYNFNEKMIDEGSAYFDDAWEPAGAMSLAEQDLTVHKVSIDENGQARVSEEALAASLYDLRINADDSGFTLEFNEKIDRQAYQIRYKTHLSGDQGTGVITSGGSVSNTVKTGTEHTDGSSGSWRQEALRKDHVQTDVGNKQIDWRIQLNRNSYLMENLVLTDTFYEDGLSLIEDAENYSDYALTLLEEDGTEFTGYDIHYTAPLVGEPGGFTLTFTEPIDRPLTLTYATHFERNSDGSANYTNQARIDWEEGETRYTSDSGEISSGNTGLTAANGVKNGQYNAVDKAITWSVHANYARLPIAEDFEIHDVLPEYQEWLPESFEVFTYEVSAKGDIINEEALDASLYTLSFSDGVSEEFSLTVSEDLIGQKEAVGISFKTAFSDGWVRAAQVANTATVVNNGETLALDASVRIPFGGVFADKDGEQTGEFSERIDWEIRLNPSQSVVSDFTLTDTPDLNSQLLTDSFVVYAADVSADGTVSKTTTVLTEGEDYDLDIVIDQETGEQSFTLSFPEAIDQAYILTYSSYIDPLVTQGEAISNAFAVEGVTTEYLDLSEEEIAIYKSNAGGGDGSSVRGNLKIQKADPDGEELAGAEFQLYTRDGEQLLRRGLTDETGSVQFGGLRRGRYLLRETQAPERFVISQELAEGIEIQLAHEEDQEVTVYEALNRPTQVSVEKITTNGQKISSEVVFSVLDENENVVRAGLTTDYGQLVIDDLDPGDYYLREDEAPNGYILNTELTPFTIDINADGTQPIPALSVVNHQGSLTFEKTDREGKPLAGAEFELYNAEGERVRTVESDQSGTVLVRDLSPGNYTVHETKAANGYILDETIRTFVIEDEHAGEPDTVELADWINYQGSVRLIKVDEQGNPLEGAVFELRQGESVIAEDSTDAEGQLTVTGLEPGAYTFVETRSPEGFVLNSDPIPFVVEAENAGEPELNILEAFTNYQGKAALIKTDESGAPLEGAAFELRDADGHLIREELLSDEEGRVQVEEIAPGTYSFVETEAADGYLLNTEGDFSFTVDDVESGATEVILAGELVNYQGSAELMKTDVDGEPLQGAVFVLRNALGTIIRDRLVTGENGSLILSDLAPGEYILVETDAPEGYIRNTDQIPFTIEDEAEGKPETVNLGSFINYQGHVQLEKMDVNGELLADAVFELTDDSGERVDLLTSNTDGIVFSGPLAPGNYQLEEVRAPEGYITNSEKLSFMIADEHSGEPLPVDLGGFTNYQGSFRLVKTDAEDEPLEGASFTLFKDGEVVADNLTSDAEGLISMEQLAPGTYELKETSTREGFILNTETVAFEIEESVDGEPAEVDLDRFINYKGAVRLHKTDDKGQPLEGATFSLMQGETVVSVHETDEQGDIIVSDLAPGDYAFVETKAPQDYSVNTTAMHFVIDEEHSGEPMLLILDDFINYTGRAVLEKTNSLGEPLSQAVFELRDEKGHLIRENLESDEDGLVYAEDLAPGAYRFIETEAPEGYLLNTEATDLFTITSSFEGELPVVDAGTLVNYTASVEWLKTDADGEPLADAVFTLMDSDGDVVREELLSDPDGLVRVDGLAPGQYILAETQAPSGYILNTETVTFDIAEESEGEPEVLRLNNWINYQGSLMIWKTNAHDEALEQAVFRLVDTNGETVADELVTDSNGRVEVEALAPGEYTLIETAAPAGYLLDETPLTVTITEAYAGQPKTENIHVVNEEVVSEPADDDTDSNDTLPQTNVTSFTLLTRLIGLLLLTIGLYVLKKQPKNN